MPKAARRTSGPSTASNRKEPYTKSSPKNTTTTADKENIDPTSTSTPNPTQTDYRSIPLPEIKSEVPCYDNAATVRRKLKALLASKSLIPGTTKKWSQASMAAEMRELESRGHAVEYNRNAVNGPTNGSLAGFLKKTGLMGGGDSPCYYWGYVLLEKLRIWEGGKKSKARVEAEGKIPTGHMRWDPSTTRLWCGPGLPMPSINEMSNKAR